MGVRRSFLVASLGFLVLVPSAFAEHASTSFSEASFRSSEARVHAAKSESSSRRALAPESSNKFGYYNPVGPVGGLGYGVGYYNPVGPVGGPGYGAGYMGGYGGYYNPIGPVGGAGYYNPVGPVGGPGYGAGYYNPVGPVGGPGFGYGYTGGIGLPTPYPPAYPAYDMCLYTYPCMYPGMSDPYAYVNPIGPVGGLGYGVGYYNPVGPMGGPGYGAGYMGGFGY